MAGVLFACYLYARSAANKDSKKVKKAEEKTDLEKLLAQVN